MNVLIVILVIISNMEYAQPILVLMLTVVENLNLLTPVKNVPLPTGWIDQMVPVL